MTGIPNNSRSATALLVAWGRGDQSAFDKLLPLVYEELRRLDTLRQTRLLIKEVAGRSATRRS
jgi:hypothetical protein